LVHDIIPIKFPNFYEQRFGTHFREHIRQVLMESEAVLVYSDNTREDLRQWSITENLKKPTFMRIHLGSDFASLNQSEKVEGLEGKPFCLYVSTLEVRKNHLLLLKTWKRLIERLGEQTPRLVFAGRRGWMIQETLDYLKSHPELNDHLVWLQNCSDNELAWLYQNCLFTLYPSRYEGWGLPVIESLAYGKLCLASGAASIPEAGSSFARYFDPESVDECESLCLSYILDPQKIRDAEKYIKDHYRQTRWSETARDLANELADVRAALRTSSTLVEARQQS
ncbi:MAG: glycosyltransferase family 4 protein, partial [Bdellovibrionales bacterium]|nr:glycosyltransferase family 4 protein [Bdellovibrionales bacterium]